MIEIETEDLVLSLKDGYTKFVNAKLKSDKDEAQLIKGWCNALEGIVFSYAPEIKDEVLLMRSEIINQSLGIQDKDLKTPTYLRKKIKI